MDEENADCLQKGQHAPDLATIKDFIRYYISSSVGRLSARPVVSSVVNFAERFFSGFNRVTGTFICREDRSEVYYVRDFSKYT
jgi:hypothetical protein